jgi:hypothetical protein
MLERRRLPADAFRAFVRNLPFAIDVNQRYLGLDEETLASRVERDLLLVNALRREDGWIAAA